MENKAALLLWLQALETEHCNQSTTINDLKDGHALLDLTNHLFYDGQHPDLLAQLDRYADCYDPTTASSNFALLF